MLTALAKEDVPIFRISFVQPNNRITVPKSKPNNLFIVPIFYGLGVLTAPLPCLPCGHFCPPGQHDWLGRVQKYEEKLERQRKKEEKCSPPQKMLPLHSVMSDSAEKLAKLHHLRVAVFFIRFEESLNHDTVYINHGKVYINHVVVYIDHVVV